MELLEKHGPFVKIYDMIIENTCEDVNIVILPNPYDGFRNHDDVILIQWYKRYHWGRALMIRGIKDEEVKDALVWIREQIEGYEE